jgi:hypothetical protein
VKVLMLKIGFGKLPGSGRGRLKPRWGRISFLVMAVGAMLLDTASLNAPSFAVGAVRGGQSVTAAEPGEASLRPWVQKDYAALNRLFDEVDTPFPRDLIKAIAWCESGWSHVDETGRLFVTVNRQGKSGRLGHRRISLDYGVMQINERMESLDRKAWDWERIKNDPVYNIRAGVAVLESKVEYIHTLKRRANWKQLEARYQLRGHDNLDLVLKAYNGFQPSWAYPRRIREALRDKPWEKAVWRQWAVSANHPVVILTALASKPTGDAVEWSAAVEGGLGYTLDLARP